jgi:hypothetical protein
MTNQSNERRNPLHPSVPAHRIPRLWLLAALGALALTLLAPAVGRAEESNPNNYSCVGHISEGTPEAGSTEQQVSYSFYCDGPITGYQLQSQIPVTGIQSPPLVSSNATKKVLADTFSCSGEVPGFALNCVGLAKEGYETITGQFAIEHKICAEPREDPLLTVTYASLEKGVLTQAISGLYDLGRPLGCKPDAYSGWTRLNPKPAASKHAKKHSKKHSKKPASPARVRIGRWLARSEPA